MTEREPVSRWWLMWKLYGLPRCDTMYPFVDEVDPCKRVIWPWQPRELYRGMPVHQACRAALRP